jgi:ABC-type transport system involved in multi-copper enzyme maturation permease subunit
MIVFQGLLAFVGGRLRDYLNTRWVWGFVVFLIASTASAIVGGYHAHLRNQERYTVEIQRRLQLVVQPRPPDGTQLDPAFRVLRPPTPSAIVIPGHEASLPAAWDFGPAGIETLAPYPPADFASEIGLMLDGEVVIRLFGGLFAIAFGAWTTTRDKLRGWSEAEAMLPIADWSVTTAHLLSGCVALALVVAAWFGITATFAHAYVDPGVQLSVPWVRLAVVAFLYMITLFGIGSSIGWWAQSPLLGIALSGAVWVFLVLLGPQLLLGVSNLLSELPSRSSLEQAQREDYRDQLRLADDNLARQLAATVPKELRMEVMDAILERAFPSFEPEWLARLGKARASTEEAERSWSQNRRRVSERLRVGARLTPGTVLPQALSEVSSVGWLATARWEDAIDSHRRRLNRALFDNRPTAGMPIHFSWTSLPWQYTRYNALPYSRLPQFEAPVITSRDSLAASWPDLVALLIQSALALILVGIARRQALRRM